MTGGLVFCACWLGEPFRGAGAPSPRTPRARRAICGGVGNAALETPLGPIQSPARRNPSSLLDLSLSQPPRTLAPFPTIPRSLPLLHPTSLVSRRRYGSSVLRLCLRNSSSIPFCSRCSSAQVVRKPREEEPRSRSRVRRRDLAREAVGGGPQPERSGCQPCSRLSSTPSLASGPRQTLAPSFRSLHDLQVRIFQDLIMSYLGLHWTNDLPGAMIQHTMRQVLLQQYDIQSDGGEVFRERVIHVPGSEV
ncbi:uncharacterized protein [Triticum aestivum]|uniref:uncharacterized protein n=1 Tax=Triticum aestivum TaxID=4565 RepID=UPI001D02DD40|nr:uncharacterized protein LOC123076201 [Triticum aestivum]